MCYRKSKSELITQENAYVVCIDGKSKGVYDELPQQYKQLPLMDYSDNLIIPGMVDLHIHAPQYAFRGLCMDLELMEWLNRYTFPRKRNTKISTMPRKLTLTERLERAVYLGLDCNGIRAKYTAGEQIML